MRPATIAGRTARTGRGVARRRVWIGVTACVLVGLAEQGAVAPALSALAAASPSVDHQLEFPAPMVMPPSASGDRAPNGGPETGRYAIASAGSPRCEKLPTPRVQRLAQRLHNGCASPSAARSTDADVGYAHPHHPAVLLDTDPHPTPVVLASNPPTYTSPDWVKQGPATAPAGRYGVAVAYDAVRKVIVAFGGTDGASYLADTWTWDGHNWTQQVPATSPPPRAWSQMAWDPATQTVILFGGETTANPALNDTWSWNGTTWSQITPSTSPAGRSEAAMAYDGSQILLFGGTGFTQGVGSADLSDTWTFNGTQWTQLTNLATSPSARSGARAAYNSVTGWLVMFGGVKSANGACLSDTWTFNGTAWSQAAPVASPSARSDYYLAYDGGLASDNPPGGSIVLFGGYAGPNGDVSDTWRWNGSTWEAAVGIASPSGRDGGAMDFDQASGQLLLFGGSDGFNIFSETWAYNTGTPTVTSATGMLTNGVASRGALFQFTITVGNPSSTIGMSNVSMTDTLPAGLITAGGPITITDTNPPPPSAAGPVPCSATVQCSQSSQSVRVSGMSIAAGDAITITYDAVALGVDRSCTTLADSALATGPSGSSGPVAAPVTVCDAGLGTSPWLTYATRSLGPLAVASVDPADGNLVVAQHDGTDIPGHGPLGFGVTRTYNSQDTGIANLPATLGAGWVFTVGQDRLAASGPVASGLVVPVLLPTSTQVPVILVEGSGARDTFTPHALPQAVDVTSMSAPASSTSPLGVVASHVLKLDAGYTHLCVDAAFAPPIGVHLDIWRYVETNGSCSSGPFTVLGFAAERIDRVRYEFAWDGHLLDVMDGNGNELRDQYAALPAAGAALGNLQSVAEVSSGRRTAFSWSSTEVDATDPAGRITRYRLDAATPARLTTVVNPDPAMSSTLSYSYGSCTGASPRQLCSATDPRGNATSFTYTSISPEGKALVGPPAVLGITDRGGTLSTLTYHSSPDYVTIDTGAERTQYLSMDAVGRVGEIDSGATTGSSPWLHESVFTWDALGHTCRQPDAVVDNDLCQVVSKAMAATPDQTTSFVYNSEGRVLHTHAVISASTSSDHTAGFHALYLQSTGAFTAYDDTVQGGGAVTSARGVGQGGARADVRTLLALSDQAQDLTPRGNAAGTGYTAYLTTYHPDDSAGVAPNTSVAGGTCPSVSGNTGNLCEIDEPDWNGSQPRVTQYQYDGYGQRTRVTTPNVYATLQAGGTASPQVLTYYQDSDRDLSGNVSAGGWLKAATDPYGNYSMMAYDAAGDVARTWDRDATHGLSLISFPGSITSAPSPAYVETLYGPGATTQGAPASAYASPWRYERSRRDQVGDLTSFTVDANGNQTVVRSPRGNVAATTAFDITQTYDARDSVLTKQLPAEASSGAKYSYGYDAFGNQTSTTDALGIVTVYQYDAVNRRTVTLWTRGPWPYDQTTVPPSCRQSTIYDAPIASGRILCSSSVSYDGVDNQTALQDGNHQVTTLSYDGIHEETERVVPRNLGGIATARTDTVYDLDGHATDSCPPRQFLEGGSSTCTSGGAYSTHVTYDALGRAVAVTTYRSVGTPPDTVRTSYDADGNVLSRTDANLNQTSFINDLTDRKLSMTVPRSPGVSNTTAYQYLPEGELQAQIMPASRITAYTYDPAHRLIDTVLGSSSADASQDPISIIGGSNDRTRRLYDADGNVVATFEPRAFGNSRTPDPSYMSTTDYDADGRRVATYSPRYGNASPDLGLTSTQTQQCTPSIRPITVPGVPSYPADVGVCATRYSYDAAGNRVLVRLATSNGSDNRYDQYAFTDDRLESTVTVPGPPGTAPRVTSLAYIYDADRKVVRKTDPSGARDDTTYSSDELVASVFAQPNGAITHNTKYGYDGNGDVTSISDPQTTANGTQPTRKAYFADSLLQSVTDQLGDTTSYVYDSAGNPVDIYSPSANAREANNTSGTPTVEHYTADNLLDWTTVPVASDGSTLRKTTYGYDGAGRKVSGDTFLVNGAGQSLSGQDSGTETFSYFPDDRLSNQQARNGTDTLKYGYDDSGNLEYVQDAVSGASLAGLTYYLDGSQRSVDNGSWTTEYSYDAAGSRDNRTYVKDSSTTSYSTTYSYGDAELVASMSAPSITQGGLTSWTYSADGMPQAESDPNGQSVQWSYNPDRTMAGMSVSNGSGQLASWAYTYDSNYRVLTAAFSGKGVSAPPVSGTFAYVYDAAGRITEFTKYSATGNTTSQVAWDRNSDRLQLDSTNWTYNADGSIASAQMGQLPAQSHTYWPFGGMKSDGCAAYAFDGFDRLSSVSQQAGTNCPTPAPKPTTYQYDGLDRIASRSDATTNVSINYDGRSASPAVEVSSGAPTGSTQTVYELGAEGSVKALSAPAATIAAQKQQFVTDDGFGNVTTVTDASASVMCTVHYDAFGVPQGALGPSNPCNTGSTADQYFYRGGREDAGSGQYHLGSRDMDPTKAGFIEPDAYRADQPAAQLGAALNPTTENGFSYANGDPVNRSDPTGRAYTTGNEDDPTSSGPSATGAGNNTECETCHVQPTQYTQGSHGCNSACQHEQSHDRSLAVAHDKHRQQQQQTGCGGAHAKALGCNDAPTQPGSWSAPRNAYKDSFAYYHDVGTDRALDRNTARRPGPGLWQDCEYQGNDLACPDASGKYILTAEQYTAGVGVSGIASAAWNNKGTIALQGIVVALNAVPGVGEVADAGDVALLGDTAAEATTVADTGGTITVGRWMSQSEFDAMSSSGRVIEGGGGRTYVTNPANPDAYTGSGPGSIFAQFDVPRSSVFPAGKPEWGVIPGPNAGTGIYGPLPSEMPPATCIVWVCSK